MAEYQDSSNASQSQHALQSDARDLDIAHAARFRRFLVVGGFAAIVNFTSRYLLTPYMGFEAAVLVAYLIGLVTAFTLFRVLVFGRSERSIASECYWFVLVNVFALGLVWSVSVGLAQVVFPAVGFVWHAEDIAHLVGICSPVITSYIGHSKYTFGNHASSG